MQVSASVASLRQIKLDSKTSSPVNHSWAAQPKSAVVRSYRVRLRGLLKLNVKIHCIHSHTPSDKFTLSRSSEHEAQLFICHSGNYNFHVPSLIPDPRLRTALLCFVCLTVSYFTPIHACISLCPPAPVQSTLLF